MEPITVLLWLWLTWGTVRMMTGAHRTAPAAEPVQGKKPRPAPAPEEAPRPGWARRADDAAARAAHATDWANPGWWVRAALAAAWTPIADLRAARRARQARDHQGAGDDTPETADAPEAPKAPTGESPRPGGGEHGQDSEPPRRERHRRTQPGGQEPGGRQEQPRDGRRDAPPWWRRQEQNDYRVDVEVIRPTALDRPAPALIAATEPADPPPPAPEGADMSKYVAIPGVTTPTTSIEVGGNTHDDAVQLSKKIVTAVKMSVDPATEAELMIRASLAAAWNAVDALAAAGISGPVIDRWANAVIAFDQAHKTAAKLATELNAAHDAAVAAEGLQRRLGDDVQAAIQAAGASAADSTGYYGKR